MAATTCHDDKSGNKTCCERWSVTTYADGKQWGRVDGDTYARLERAVKSRKETDKRLCRYWGSDDSSCRTTYGPPRCDEGDSRRTRSVLSPTEQAAILENTGRLLDHWSEMLRDAANRFREAESGHAGRNPYEGIGGVTKDYGDLLNDVLVQQKKIKALLKAAHEKASSQLLRDIAELTRDFEQSAGRLQRSYDKLPTDIREPRAPSRKQTAGDGAPAKDGVAPGSAPTRGTSRESAIKSADSCPDLTGCLDLVDATWDSGDPTRAGRGAGRMTVTISNTCSQSLRLALWMPQSSGYSPTYFEIAVGSTVTKTATGARNEWQLQASHASASDACLKYP